MYRDPISGRKSCRQGLGEGLERSESFTDWDLGEPQSMNFKRVLGFSVQGL